MCNVLVGPNGQGDIKRMHTKKTGASDRLERKHHTLIVWIVSTMSYVIQSVIGRFGNVLGETFYRIQWKNKSDYWNSIVSFKNIAPSARARYVEHRQRNGPGGVVVEDTSGDDSDEDDGPTIQSDYAAEAKDAASNPNFDSRNEILAYVRMRRDTCKELFSTRTIVEEYVAQPLKENRCYVMIHSSDGHNYVVAFYGGVLFLAHGENFILGNEELVDQIGEWVNPRATKILKYKFDISSDHCAGSTAIIMLELLKHIKKRTPPNHIGEEIGVSESSRAYVMKNFYRVESAPRLGIPLGPMRKRPKRKCRFCGVVFANIALKRIHEADCGKEVHEHVDQQ